MPSTPLGKKPTPIPKAEPKRMVEKLIHWTTPLAISVVVLVLGLGAWLMIWPKVQEIQALKDAVTEQRAYNEELTTAVRKLERFLKAYEDLKNDPTTNLAMIDVVMPASEDVPGLLVGSENIAQELRLPLQDVHVGADGKGVKKALAKGGDVGVAGVKTLPYTLSFGGSVDYPQYRLMLDTLARNQRLMDLDGIAFGAGDASQKGSDAEGLTFDLTTYTFNPSP